jgi:hypothetical protein
LTLFEPGERKTPVKHIFPFLLAALVAGCSGTHPKGTSHMDEFDAVKVDQMVGNNVSASPLQKTILCLNARRETHGITALTNVDIRSVSAPVINALTNEVITHSTNYLVTTMTNLAPAQPGQTPPPPLTGESAAAAVATVTNETATVPEGTVVVAATNNVPLVQGSTNVTASLALNNSATAGPTQRAANNQVVRTFNNQIMTQTNNLSITLMTNLIVTAETNATVSFVTNLVLTSVTNITVTPTNFVEHEYFVFTEMVPPADFVPLTSGETLVLLVDGVRYGLSPSPSGTAFVGRKGYNSTLYRTTPELLVAIANANEVRVRVKGNSSVIERSMNERSRRNFKTFLVRYFSPESNGGGGESPPANATGTATGVASAHPAPPVNLP